MEISLTTLQSYQVAQLFLDRFYEETQSDDAAVLLSGMNLFRDGGSWDPAMWGEWLDCLKQVGVAGLSPTPLQAFYALRKFLEILYQTDSSTDPLAALPRHLQRDAAAGITDQEMWARWMQCVKDVLEGRGPGPGILYKDGVAYIP
jgi:hypothetical protein